MSVVCGPSRPEVGVRKQRIKYEILAYYICFHTVGHARPNTITGILDTSILGVFGRGGYGQGSMDLLHTA